MHFPLSSCYWRIITAVSIASCFATINGSRDVYDLGQAVAAEV